MSQGKYWIDHVMISLSVLDDDPLLVTDEYNRVYEAVSRGTEEQGRALVAAITKALWRARHGMMDMSGIFLCKCTSPDIPGMLGAVCAKCHGYIVQGEENEHKPVAPADGRPQHGRLMHE